jgi:group I intron endonuclease
MKICGIYKITSPTNRIYIGQSIDIKWRFSNYRRIDKGVRTSVKLYRSLKKYGSENHKFEIIEECTIDNLNERERYWQEFYNATSEEHLNCILTSTKDKKGISRPISEKQKQQISAVHKGKVISEETRNKIKLARSKQIITEEHKRKMSENSGCARIVLDFSTGVFYNSAKEVSTLYGIVPNTLVNKLIGRNKNNTNFAYV